MRTLEQVAAVLNRISLEVFFHDDPAKRGCVGGPYPGAIRRMEYWVVDDDRVIASRWVDLRRWQGS